MTKLQLLHRALNERMMAAVEQIMEMVGGTVLEYEEETTRVRKENEVLRRRLQWMEESSRADWPGTWDPVTLSTPDNSNPTQHEESVVSFDFGQESQAVVIKTESTDNPLFVRPQSSLATMTQGTEQGSAVDETSAHFDQGNRAGSWDSTQSYMAPLEFDPSSSSRLRCYEVKGKRQRMSFACPDCGKVFGRKQGLIFHMRVHSTERPYVYRSRKECIYTDIRRYKRRGLPKRSRENTEDLSDSSEQANRSSPSAEHPEKSDQTSRDKGPENITSKPVPFPRKRKQKNKIACCRCPLCGQGFSQKDQLTLHLKSHVQKARQSPVTYPNKARSGDGERQKVAVLSSRCFSRVWDYFSKDPSDQVVCNMCSAKISQGSNKAAHKNTSNLWSHLRIKHANKYFEAKGFVNPINLWIKTLDPNEVKLEHCEQGESEIMQELKKEEPCFENL